MPSMRGARAVRNNDRREPRAAGEEDDVDLFVVAILAAWAAALLLHATLLKGTEQTQRRLGLSWHRHLQLTFINDEFGLGVCFHPVDVWQLSSSAVNCTLEQLSPLYQCLFHAVSTTSVDATQEFTEMSSNITGGRRSGVFPRPATTLQQLGGDIPE
ncbi:hypothetical protein K438DRAFT_1776941 [Mycena galopus ATCC 62051]|nr:hypothetical protein K438DRAFT_1776941 [Mycena galopus ATCC 62051]